MASDKRNKVRIAQYISMIPYTQKKTMRKELREWRVHHGKKEKTPFEGYTFPGDPSQLGK